MIAWRSETVITFHIDAQPGLDGEGHQATGQLEVRARASALTAPPTIVSARDGRRRGAWLTPGRGQAADDAADGARRSPMMAKVVAPTCSTSWP